MPQTYPGYAKRLQPTLIYDGHCPLCVRWAGRLRAWAGEGRLNIVALEAPGAMELHPELNLARAIAALQLIRSNGSLCQGAKAAYNAVALRPGFGWIRFLYPIPILRQMSDLAYHVISRKRRRCALCD